ncbi:MAG: hypothetical protein HWN68_15705 [Desulfobacterales bacterium]|nr:hypothetical protein [Desulfobacterales bacterium]
MKAEDKPDEAKYFLTRLRSVSRSILAGSEGEEEYRSIPAGTKNPEKPKLPGR